jgi:DNA-binding LacI/PurR family transcriptional regulator
VPNGLARSLQARSSRTIGVLLNKPLTTPRYAEIAQGLSEGLARRGFHLALLDGDSAANCIDDARGGLLDGLVFIGHDDHEVPEVLAAAVREHRIPFVTLDCGPATVPAGWSSVDFDYAAGVAQVVQNLVAGGTTRLLHLRPDVTSRADRARNDAMEAEASAAGLELVPISTGMTDEVLSRVDQEPSSGTTYATGVIERLDAAREWVLQQPAATALVCSWGADVEAAYAWVSQNDPGLRVAALAGGILDPRLWRGLTYSRLPLAAAGDACAGLIVDASRAQGESAHVLLTPQLDTGDRRPDVESDRTTSTTEAHDV